MPCLILTGYPSSGKSTLAELFRERALLLFRNNNKNDHDNNKKKKIAANTMIEHVVIVTEATACPDQTTRACYIDSQAEKATRSALKAAFDRAVGAAAAAAAATATVGTGRGGGGGDTDASSKTTLIILDSMNYIKGFRYELFCISKAAKERHAVVWVMNDVAVSKQWNEKRKTENDNSGDGDFYTNEQMEELILRYEPPDARNRWDKPLYRVDMRPLSSLSSQQQQTQDTTTTPRGDSSSSSNSNQQQQGLAKETVERSVYNMHDLSEAIHLQQETTIHAPNKKTTSMGGFKRASASTKVRSNQNNNNNNNTNTMDSQSDNNKQLEESANKPVAVDASKCMENESLEKTTTQTLGETSSSSPSSSRVMSLEERVDAILDSFLNHVQPLQQSFSTQEQLSSSDANVLQKVDMVTQHICQAIVTARNKQPTSSGDVGGNKKLAIHLQPQQSQQQQEEEPLWLNCHRGLPLSWTELHRLRKQYMQWVKSQPPRDTSQRGIAQSFLQYIEASVQQ